MLTNLCMLLIPLSPKKEIFNTAHFDWSYLIPIKIRAPLIFAHLACAKMKGSKVTQYECAKIKGRRKNATNE